MLFKRGIQNETLLLQVHSFKKDMKSCFCDSFEPPEADRWINQNIGSLEKNDTTTNIREKIV